jgi:hypothetical protein
MVLLSWFLFNVTVLYPQTQSRLGDIGQAALRNTTVSPAAAGRKGQYNGKAARSTVSKESRFRSALEFGPLARGADDTANLQTAITASAGKTLWLPNGIYKISPNPSRTHFLTIPANTKIIGGGGAVLQVAASAGYYDSILSIGDGTGVVLRGFTIDSNIANNPISNSAEISSHARIEVKVLNGKGTVIEKLTLKNSSSMNAIFANFSFGFIRNNIVIANGNDPNGIPHDNSVIYTGFSIGNVVAGNILNASAIAAPAATNGIEIHGSNHFVRDNKVSNFANCINVAGVDRFDNGGSVIEKNTCVGALSGIQIASLKYSGHERGYGINGLLITGNYIRINQASYISKSQGMDIFVDPAITLGIVFNTANSLPVRGVKVSYNRVIWDREGDVMRSVASIGAGVFANANQYTDIEFGSNELENAPLTGIRFEATCVSCKFHGNIIRNAASTGRGIAATAAERSALFFYGLNTFKGLEVYNNIVIDGFSNTKLRNHLFVGAESLCTDVKFVSNSLTTADSNHSNLLGYISLVDSNVVPYLFAIMPSGYFSGLAQSVTAGSTYLDYGAKKVWYSPTGETWSARF